jgi:hypothetical protein
LVAAWFSDIFGFSVSAVQLLRLFLRCSLLPVEAGTLPLRAGVMVGFPGGGDFAPLFELVGATFFFATGFFFLPLLATIAPPPTSSNQNAHQVSQDLSQGVPVSTADTANLLNR